MKFAPAALALIALASCTLHVHVHEAPREASTSPVGGTWSVHGHDQIPWSAQLVLDEESHEGHFDWRSAAGDSGRELLTWRHDPSTATLRLEGVEMLNSVGNIGVGTYSAQVTPDGQRLVGGTWGPPAIPGTWEARR